jgi:hypothetical protein
MPGWQTTGAAPLATRAAGRTLGADDGRRTIEMTNTPGDAEHDRPAARAADDAVIPDRPAGTEPRASPPGRGETRPRGLLRLVAYSLGEFAITAATVLGIGYAVFGESPYVATAAILVGLVLSRSRASIRRGSLARRLAIAIPTGIGGILIAIVLRSGELIAFDNTSPSQLPARFLAAIALFGAFGAIVGFVYNTVVVRRYHVRPSAYPKVSAVTALVFLGLQVLVGGWPAWPPGQPANWRFAETLVTSLCSGVALVFGVHRLGQPAGREMRLAIQEFGKARPYWRAMLRPVEAIVLIYVLVILLFACIFASAYRLDPAGAFSRGAADAEVTFLEFIYFSAVTMGTVGYGDITPLSPFTRGVAIAEILFSAFFLVITFAALTAYLQHVWTRIAYGDDEERRPRGRGSGRDDAEE